MNHLTKFFFASTISSIPFLVLINYLASMRFDAYKVCKVRRRPLAQRTGGIGVWEHLLHIVAVIAVLTNCWLVAFFHKGFRDVLEKVGPTATVFLIVAWEHIMLLIKYLMGNIMSSLPKEIRDEIKQKQHESENKRYEEMRLKTEQTRRLKREKSFSIAPDSASRSSPFRRESKRLEKSFDNSCLKTPENEGHPQTIESSEVFNADRSTDNDRNSQRSGDVPSPRSSIAYRNDRNLDGSVAFANLAAPETSGHLQRIESFDEHPATKNKLGELRDSVPSVQSDLTYVFSESNNAYACQGASVESSNKSVDESVEESIIDSRPGELFEC